MKNMRRIFYIYAALSLAFTLLMAVISCSDPLSTPGSKESGVIIRIAGSDGRTILPETYKFSYYKLFLQKEDDPEPTHIPNTEGIESGGVHLNLSAGKWTITLNAYQIVFEDDVDHLAAVGSAGITVTKEDGLKTVLITLEPIQYPEFPGLFSFDITLPQDAEEAVLKLKNEGDYNKEFDLTDKNSGSIKISAGFYDMSIILKKNGQNAGWFESVHIYSGLESPAKIDLSGIVFTDHVYVAGTLGGIRLGTIQIFDEDKTLIKELNLENETKAVRTADWIADIPSSNIGKAVYVTQVFEGEIAAVFEISELKASGKDKINLTLIPSNDQSQNIAPWYSTVSSSGGENPRFAADGNSETCWNISAEPVWLELDYGFNVSVNDAQVIFSDGTGPTTGGYSVEYWNGAAWIQAASRNLTGAEEYDCFFTEVTASKFRLNINAENGGAIAEFGLSFATGRVPELLQAASSYHEVTLVWKEEAQKADEYKINYKYDGGAWLEAGTVARGDCERDASNNFKYTFMPDGHNNALRSGLELQFMVEAVNNTTGDIIPSEEDVKAKLIGPALLSPSANTAASADTITVSWNKVEGAGGYYVFRRQFNLNNTAQEGTFIQYYVPGAASGTITVTGKGLASGADTTTVKAAASVSGSRFTLTDTWMTDAEYNNAYKTYGTYRDQQNDMAQGKPYHYFIVPVLANEPLASVSYTGGAEYTLQGVIVTNAGSLEKTGFTVGFGQNVTATKGTYASTGNVNNGIQITWEKPPLLTGSPQYTLYRKASSGNWESVSTSATSPYTSTNETRGTVYEYAVGVNGSRPDTSERFLTNSRAQLDGKGIPKPFGYMLEMVKLKEVSRKSIVADSQFAEQVTMYKNSNQYYNKGIDGYTVYLLNRNINNGRQWITLGDIGSQGDGTEATQTDTHINYDDRLKVLRDYRHYYYMRSFVNNNGNKIYCPDYAPSYVWTDGAENDYVKWGARQVSADEFAAITALSIGTGMNWWAYTSSSNRAPDWRSDHNVDISESNIGYNRDINFSNSKPYFITVNGHLYGYCTASRNTPTQYGADCAGGAGALSGAKDHLSTLTITGPSDVNGMYSGTVKILRMGSGSGNGPYKVSYNGQNDQGVDAKHYRDCFTFTGGNQSYKFTKDFDWSSSGGIASTNKWWYSLTSNRAGWD